MDARRRPDAGRLQPGPKRLAAAATARPASARPRAVPTATTAAELRSQTRCAPRSPHYAGRPFERSPHRRLRQVRHHTEPGHGGRWRATSKPCSTSLCATDWVSKSTATYAVPGDATSPAARNRSSFRPVSPDDRPRTRGVHEKGSGRQRCPDPHPARRIAVRRPQRPPPGDLRPRGCGRPETRGDGTGPARDLRRHGSASRLDCACGLSTARASGSRKTGGWSST